MNLQEEQQRRAHYAKVAQATAAPAGQPAEAPQDARGLQTELAKWLAAGNGATPLPDGASSDRRA